MWKDIFEAKVLNQQMKVGGGIREFHEVVALKNFAQLRFKKTFRNAKAYYKER